MLEIINSKKERRKEIIMIQSDTSSASKVCGLYSPKENIQSNDTIKVRIKIQSARKIGRFKLPGESLDAAIERLALQSIR
jgi:hypothetical protein